MAVLTRDAILSANDLETRRVPVPEWSADPANPDEVIVRGLTATERDSYEMGFMDPAQLKHNRTQINAKAVVRARLASLTIVDEAGVRLFNEGDVKALGKKSAAALDRVVAVAREVSGMTEDDEDELAESFAEGLSADDVSS